MEVKELLSEGLASGTRKRYVDVQQRFVDFCAIHNLCPCPCTGDTILRFLAWSRDGGAKPGAGVNVAVAAIRNLLIMNGADLACLGDPRLKQMRLALIKETPKRESRQPLTCENLRAICASLGDSFSDRLFKAGLTLGFFGLLRLSDFMLKSGSEKEASLLISGVTWEPEGLVLTLQGTKTDRQNRGQTVTIAATRDGVCPKEVLVRYLLVRPRSGSKSLLLNPDGKPLTAWNFRKRLIAECGKAGIEGNVNGHSLRIGGATALSNLGVQEETIRTMGRWKSDVAKR